MSRIEISAALPEVKLGKITTIFFKFILRILISVWLTATLVDQNSWSPSLLASALEDVRCSLTLHARPLCRLLADRCSYPAALHFTSGYLHWKQHSHGEKVQRAGAACGHVHRAGGENMQVLTPTTNWGALLSEPPQAAYCFSALGPAGCAKGWQPDLLFPHTQTGFIHPAQSGFEVLWSWVFLCRSHANPWKCSLTGPGWGGLSSTCCQLWTRNGW